jgi:RNA polymerase sigma-70 factor (ECF subfamily)
MSSEGANRSSMPESDTQFRAMEDRELVIAFKAGDPDAYDEMYRRYSGRVGGVCRRMLSNRDDAQEAVQETFLKAYLALPEFNGNYRLGAWLGRIASNVCVDLLRARARGANVVPLQPHAGALAIEDGPEETVIGSGPEVAQQIGELQPLHARALVMRGVEGLSHREIAGRLSMTPAQVKALLHRARRSFKRSWENAKGWALAPVALLRAGSRQLRSATQTGSQIAGATATVSPLVAERVAASAVIVAVALTGLPTSSVTQPAEDEVRRRRPVTSEWVMTSPRVTIERRAPERRERTAARAPRDAVRVSVVKDRVLPTLEKVLARAEGTVDSPPRKRSEDGDDDLVPLGPKAARETAKEIVQDVEELLPD